MLETQIKMTPELAAEHGLTAEEYARVLKILGREPSITELGVFSVMWSEHCSYKSSRVHLRRLPTKAAQVIQGPGENAGVVDIGDGLCATFKIESHNHPSYVEPFQGAATGVGGILRDIFTMGARPIAVLDALRFGPLSDGPGVTPAEASKNRRILDGVVRGIGFYGNCFGVPTVGGDVAFAPCYSGNPLVNALALGIARREELFFARASGVGNPVLYVGSKTGRDGIHGASLLASAEFSEESQQKRPNVQVGDPFLEKLLLEACLEAMQTGAIVAIQDMGAAGLTSSSCEMAARGGVGIELDLDRVPQRESGMTPYEIMLSESQERMLLVAERGREREVMDVFAKWELDAVEVGRVTDDGLLRITTHGHVAAEIPAKALADEAPVYKRPIAAPKTARGAGPLMEFAAETADLTQNFLRLLAWPAIANKRWIWEQYDQSVRTNTLAGPGASDAAVLRVKGTARGLALSVDGNGRWCWLAPREGAAAAVAEAARNVACSGARPWAATNCLNFGNPEKPEVMWEFSECVDGIAEACTALGIPITGGNVSFYNDTLGQSIYPTPILGVLGLLEDASRTVGTAFQREGDLILLLDGSQDMTSGGNQAAHVRRELSSSEYAFALQGIAGGAPPHTDLQAEKRLIEALVAMASAGLLRSAHDISEGGLAVTLAESCLTARAREDALTGSTRHLSTEVTLQGSESAEAALFGERGARAVISVAPEVLARIREIAREYSVTAREMGRVTRGDFRIIFNKRIAIQSSLDQLRDAWGESLGRILETR
ncbi:MAG TPA: phosphoribosylformylglycinamidine synthase subunit PurL [Candidatus Acidoferrales bacterium]|nr:phosphoribosylformylglycinamidine synthase subunit PurL [Candidatus Acidoferrales bacterium]